MTSKTFVSGTVLDSAWLNDVNDATYAADTAPVGSFRESLESSAGASLVGYLPAGTEAVATTVQSKLRESVSVLDFFIAGEADSTDMFQRALDSVPNYAGAFCPSKASGGAGEVDVIVPEGTYAVSDVLVMNQRAYQRLIGKGRVTINSSSTGYIIDMASCWRCGISNIDFVSSTASVGILMTRASSNPFCDYNEVRNVNITLASDITKNSNNGNVGIVMNRAEQNLFYNCAITADIPLWSENASNASFPPTNGVQDTVITSNTVNVFFQCNWTKHGSHNYGMIMIGTTSFKFINNYWNDLRVTAGSIPYMWLLQGCTSCAFSGTFDDLIRLGNVVSYNYYNDFDLILPSANFDFGVFHTDTAGNNYLSGGTIKIYPSGDNTGHYLFYNSGAGGTGRVNGNKIVTYSTLTIQTGMTEFNGNTVTDELGLQSINLGNEDLTSYQEGTWTPTVGGTATYTTQVGTYIKVGKLVSFHGHLKINVLGTGLAYNIQGLPFTSANDGIRSSVVINEWNTLAATPVYAVGSVLPNGTAFGLNGIAAAGTTLTLLSILGNGSELYFSGSYISAT